MFSKAKRDTLEEPSMSSVEDAKTMNADNAASQAKRQKQQRQAPLGVPSLISGDMVIKGEIRSEGEVQFDGEIEGDLHAKGLVIGEGATVRGQVIAEKVKVAGQVEGKIRATRVELTNSALVRGDIVHTALMIEAGARFEGSCRHSDNPTSDSQPALIGQAAPKDDALVATPQPNAPREREAKLREAATAAPLRRGDTPPKQAAEEQPAKASKVNLR